MSNGYLKRNEKGEWQGKIETLEIEMAIRLSIIPESERRNENSPHFEIFARRRDGSPVKVGVAFEKRMQDSGEPFYSMTVDDPSLSRTLYVTAFPARGHDGFDIVWQRPRKKEAA